MKLQNGKFEPSDKKLGESGWTYVAVEPFVRVEGVDNGQFLDEYKNIFYQRSLENSFLTWLLWVSRK